MATTLEWFGCSTYRLVIDDLILFLDAYLDRPDSAPAVGLRAAEIRECDFILVGHSHWDHLWGAEIIARNTNTVIIGSYETARVMIEEEGIPEDQVLPVSGGEEIRLSNDVSVQVFPSLHSCIWAPTTGGLGKMSDICIGNTGVFHQDRLDLLSERVGKRELGDLTSSSMPWSHQTPRGDGGALCYLIKTPYGNIFYKDTMGHYSSILESISPDIALLAAAGRGNIDGEPIQGSGINFLMKEIDALNPNELVLGHYDDFSGSGTPAMQDLSEVYRALNQANSNTNLHELEFNTKLNLFPVEG